MYVVTACFSSSQGIGIDDLPLYIFIIYLCILAQYLHLYVRLDVLFRRTIRIVDFYFFL